MYRLSDYVYNLPEHLIAQYPAHPADSAKLLVPSWDGIFLQKHITDLPMLLDKNTVIFLNDTRVVQARIPLHNVRVITRQGREVVLEYGEIFFLYKHGEYRCEALITLLKRNRPWTKIFITESIVAEIIELTDKWVIIDFSGIAVDELMMQYGHMPLPPYIAPTIKAQQKYQTIFAKHDGSVAAPTASLHLTKRVMDALQMAGIKQEFVTLHVWLGTFKPVDTPDIREYHIHEEEVIIDVALFEKIAQYMMQWKTLMAVGTTVARVLETLPYVRKKVMTSKLNIIENDSNIIEDNAHVISNDSHVISKKTQWSEKSLARRFMSQYWPETQDFRYRLTQDITSTDTEKYILSITHMWDNKLHIKTRIFIYPWFQWRVVQKMMTNFHLPWSTLLMMIASFIGYDTVMRLYNHAVDHEYRFFSFGDAMLLHHHETGL
jgi:S-adenosylmethionine:tRNA ribosyltransferase-isomerase